MANPVGRPRKPVDFELVDKLCALHCTADEIAWACNVSTTTLDVYIKEQQKPDGTFYKNFQDYFSIKCSKGKIKLRELQWRSANKGNVTMQMWLGKNIIDQTDKQQIDLGGDKVIKIILDEDEE
jgi:hypothetical protein